MQHQSRSSANIRIEGRQQAHKIQWRTEPWRFWRALFLSKAQGGCSWCGNMAAVVAHPSGYSYGHGDYLAFELVGCYPLCVPCNNAEFQGKVLCPRCRRQHHYCAPGEVCWSCLPEEERERRMFLRDQRNRNKNTADRQRYNRSHTTVKVVNPRTGVWVSIQR